MSYYREGDYYLIDDQTGFRIRRSRAVVQWDGKIVEMGHEDPPPPARLTIPPYRQPKLVRPTPTPTFIELVADGFQSGAYQSDGFQQ